MERRSGSTMESAYIQSYALSYSYFNLFLHYLFPGHCVTERACDHVHLCPSMLSAIVQERTVSQIIKSIQNRFCKVSATNFVNRVPTETEQNLRSSPFSQSLFFSTTLCLSSPKNMLTFILNPPFLLRSPLFCLTHFLILFLFLPPLFNYLFPSC